MEKLLIGLYLYQIALPIPKMEIVLITNANGGSFGVEAFKLKGGFMVELKFRFWEKSLKRWGMEYENCMPQLHSDRNGGLINYQLFADDFEICQFTGRKDKTGEEIYSNHIVKNGLGSTYIINPCVGGFELIDVKDKTVFTFSALNDYCEIIGNKFENPDLLESPQ